MNIITYEQLTPELAAAGCLVTGMPNEAYHAYAGISKSGLDLVARSPAHYAYRTPNEPSRAMVIGSATHAAILEPELFAKQYMLLRDVTDRRSSAYKQAAEQFGADNVLTGSEADSVIGMQSAIQLNRSLQEMLQAPGWCEISVFASCHETGVLVKCRFDKLLHDLRSVDVKTTQDLREFGKSVANYRYHVQQSFYTDVFEWATGKQLQSFDFAVIEKEAPNASRLFRLDTPAQDYGRKLYREALNTYAECMKSGDWPMPDGALEYVGLPYWAQDPDSQEGF
jgi:hypothetical protein